MTADLDPIATASLGEQVFLHIETGAALKPDVNVIFTIHPFKQAKTQFLDVHARRRTGDEFAGATYQISFDGGATFQGVGDATSLDTGDYADNVQRFTDTNLKLQPATLRKDSTAKVAYRIPWTVHAPMTVVDGKLTTLEPPFEVEFILAAKDVKDNPVNPGSNDRLFVKRAGGRIALPAGGGNFIVRVSPPTKGFYGKPWAQDDTAFFPVDVPLVWDATKSSLTIAPPAAGKPPLNEANLTGKGPFTLDVFLSRVRDITDVAVRVFDKTYPDQPAFKYPLRADFLADAKHRFTPAQIVVPGQKIAPVARTNGPSADDIVRCFDVAAPASEGAAATNFNPKLVGAYYPASAPSASPPNYLLYYKPDPTQDSQSPFYDRDKGYEGSGYYFWSFFCCLYYAGEPWASGPNWFLGLINQIAESGKKVGLVFPLPEKIRHIGHGTDPAFVEEMIAEIHAHVLRARKVFSKPPEVARVAALAFSNGNGFLKTFLSYTSSPFILNKLREVYMLDPPGQDKDVLDAAGKVHALWPAGEGAIRYYGKFAWVPPLANNAAFHKQHDILNKGLPTDAFPADHSDAAIRDNYPAGSKVPPNIPGFDEHGFYIKYATSSGYEDTWDGGTVFGAAGIPDGKPGRTFAFLPPSVWPGPMFCWRGVYMHYWIPATMVTHALRHSHFA